MKKINNIKIELSAGKVKVTQGIDSIDFPVKDTRKVTKAIEEEANKGSAHIKYANKIFAYWCAVMKKDSRAKFTPVKPYALRHFQI